VRHREARPIAGLCFVGEYVVLGEQRGQGGVPVDLKLHGFGGGDVGVAACEYIGEPVCQGQRLGLVEMRLDLVRVGDDHIGVVAVLAARHRHVEALQRRGFGVDERVRGGNAGSLSTVNRGGVAELRSSRTVLRGQHEGFAVGLVAAPKPANSERAISS